MNLALVAICLIAIIAISAVMATAIQNTQSGTSTLGFKGTKFQCSDRIDNDGDGFIDYPNDAGCASRNDNDETNCGDAVCEGGETCSSCATDCGQCNSCSDTDGGSNPVLKGTVSGYYNGSGYSYTDFCINNITLNEYYCSGSRYYSNSMNCIVNTTRLCVDGACVW